MIYYVALLQDTTPYPKIKLLLNNQYWLHHQPLRMIFLQIFWGQGKLGQEPIKSLERSLLP